jgi:hypothetical protein
MDEILQEDGERWRKKELGHNLPNMEENYLNLLEPKWSGRLDLNQRPQRPERCALPG